MSKAKWYLNPKALLREMPRQKLDPSYRKTICGIHSIIWTKINATSIKDRLSEEELSEINALLETAFLMGKRMDYRLRKYFANEHGSKHDALAHSMKGEFVSEVPKKEWSKP